ncbi:MAG: hypothetical protein GXO50_09175 [Chlorobi bacterium]|nr:hypothetical protein [Chlorobiota bacterium]
MQIKHLTHKEINKNLWDKKIISSANSRIYGLSGWLDTVSPEWHALVSENYDFIMPLTVKKKYFINYIIQPPFTQQSGIFYADNISKEVISLFLKNIPGKYIFKIINFNAENSDVFPAFGKKPNHLLYLGKSYDYLQNYFSKNTVRNIKKAEKLNLKIHKNTTISEAVNLKRNNNINNLSDNALKMLEKLIEFSEKNYSIKIYGAKTSDGELLSVSVFIFFGKRVYVPLISSSETGKKSFASFLVFNEFIKDFSKKNFILDFEGSSVRGVARFFEGWGAEPEYYGIYKKTVLFC